MPRVSVIIPVYNVEAYLRQCMDSVVNQTLRDIEIVCIDDGSVDASGEILSEYGRQDTRIRIIHQKNQGAAVARNAGIAAATGDWIAFMDSDDKYPALDVLEKMVSNAEREGVDICGGSLQKISSAGKLVGRRFLGDNAGYAFASEGLLNYSDYQFDYGYWRFIYRRSFLKDAGIGFPLLRRFQDPPFFVEAMIKAGKFYALDIPTYCYREGEGYKDVDWRADNCLRARHYVDGVVRVLEMADAAGLGKLKSLTTRRLFKGGGAFIWQQNLSGSIADNLSPVMNKLTDLVSIVVPVYNVEKYLAECLDSLLAQTWRNIEIICVNDGSTDGSFDILKQYQEKDRRIKVVSKPNAGLGAARNTGLSIAQGKYIVFVDSDDKLDVNGIYELYNLSEREQLDQLIMSAQVFHDSDEVVADQAKFESYYRLNPDACNIAMPGRELLVKLCDRQIMPVSQPLRLFRMAYLKEIGFRYPEGILHEDNAIAFTSLIAARRAMAIPRKYYQRRLHAGSIMQSDSNRLERAHGLIVNAIALKAEIAKQQGHAELQETLQIAIDCLARNAFYQLQFLIGNLRHYKHRSYATRHFGTYRVGMVVTWLACKFLGGIRCLQENGAKYTVRHVVCKVLRLCGRQDA